MHFGLQQQQQPLDSSVAEHHDVVNRLKCGNDFRALVRRNDRSSGTLQRRDRPIVVDGNDQTIRFSRRTAQVSNVTDVQQIEASIRKSDAPTLRRGRVPLYQRARSSVRTSPISQRLALLSTSPLSTFNFTSGRSRSHRRAH